MPCPVHDRDWLLATLLLAGVFGNTSAQTCPGVCGGPLQNPVEWSSLAKPELLFTQGKINLPGLAAQPTQVQTRLFRMPNNTLLAGPTIRVKPGKKFTIPLNNQMPYQETDNPDNPHLHMHDEPYASTVQHGFDVVNMHTHGLHVSPKGHADNVLLNLFPATSPKDTVSKCQQQVKSDPVTRNVCAQGKWETRIEMPKAHASGTYWYHTHKHGAVALHLSSGLSGALIVEDDKNGLESLSAVQNNIKYGREKVMLVQSLTFATPTAGTAGNQINCQTVYGNPVSCAGDPAMNPANTQLSINGQFNPVISLYTGEAQLWRMVNTASGAVLPVCFSALTSGAPLPQSYVLAADGVPVRHPGNTPFILQQQPVFNVSENGNGLASNEFQFLASGQRLDLLVQAPTQTGWYVLLNGPAPGSTAATPLQQVCPPSLTAEQIGLIKTRNAANVVAWVQVIAPPANASFNQVIPTQAQLNQLYTAKSVIGAKDVPPSPTQGVVFGFSNSSYTPDSGGNPTQSKIGGASMVNGRPFFDGQIQRRLKLDKAERWGVQSAVDTHMFHIHTNSFQLQRRGNVPYPFPIWRDTVLINCSPAAAQNVNGIQNCLFQAGLTSQFYNTQNGVTTLSQTTFGEVMQFASRAVDYDGAIVMHCHNTGHEDNGMMELVEMFK